MRIALISDVHGNAVALDTVLADAARAGVDRYRVENDEAAFADAVRRSRHPSADFILGFLRGEHPGPAPHADNVPFPPGRTLRVAYPTAGG